MGGMIAYEIAQQLLRRRGDRHARAHRSSSHYGARLRAHAARSDGFSPTASPTGCATAAAAAARLLLSSLGDATRFRGMRRRVRRRGAVANRYRTTCAMPNSRRFHLDAYRDYVVRPYAGKVTLFRDRPGPDLGDDPHLGWVGVAADVEVFDIPGNHHGIGERAELPHRLCRPSRPPPLGGRSVRGSTRGRSAARTGRTGS